ncbi:hypothetical protein GOBAR_AA14278 [Gossypium barbadense]|uniref:Reverse transcriptase zinc-binding domain-containing protein n=1 Tax=Gossypium barbadense TaxID=3634 RepID=A0A2P5XSP0_GOSBA|nr:hypothetical protein GOBAR_AA14278 [Gossypium barbadense]
MALCWILRPFGIISQPQLSWWWMYLFMVAVSKFRFENSWLSKETWESNMGKKILDFPCTGFQRGDVLCVTNEDNVQLMASFNIHELRDTVFSMHSDKASGFDGDRVGGLVWALLCSILRVLVPLNHERYLGHPSFVGRNTSQVFTFIKEKLCKCIFSCKNSVLSKLGKEVVIKNVAQAWPEWWCLLSNLNSLSSHYFKAKYFPYCFFIEASEGRNPSYVWRSICAEKGLVNRGSRWRVGTDGFFVQLMPLPDMDLKVKELFNSGRLTWEEEFIIGILTPDSARIMKFPVNLVKSPNCMVWHFNTDGKYRRGEEGSITYSNLIHLVLSQPLYVATERCLSCSYCVLSCKPATFSQYWYETRQIFDSMSLAAVLRNDTSQFVMAYSSYVTTTMEPHFGEALAIQKVLSWLKGLRLD